MTVYQGLPGLGTLLPSVFYAV